jgi:hypothetical protein
MAIVAGRNEWAKEICDALGIKYCRKLDLHLEVDSVATVEVEYYPEEDGVLKLVPIFKKYRLEEIDDEVGKTE